MVFVLLISRVASLLTLKNVVAFIVIIRLTLKLLRAKTTLAHFLLVPSGRSYTLMTFMKCSLNLDSM